MPKNPHANFKPTLKGYSEQGAFRFWCQMALPLTFDDSLSYYELLNKVVTYLNNTIGDVGNVEDNVAALNEAYGKLEDYVNTYFDEIDIEAELRNVLDAMAEDGSLDSLLDPLVAARLGNVVAEQINAVVADQIDGAVSEQIDDAVLENLPSVVPEAVSEWLNKNVTPTTPVVDKTLLISGAAADARVTGVELKFLKNLNKVVYSFSKNLYNPNDPDVLHEKYLDINGNIRDYANRTVSGYIPVEVGKKLVISRVVNGVQQAFTWAAMCMYDNELNVITGGNYNQSGTVIPSGVAFVRCTFTSTYPEIQIELRDDENYTSYEDFKITLNPVVEMPAVENIEEELKTSLRNINGTLYNLLSVDIENKLRFNPGYMGQNGIIGASTALKYSNKIPVLEGDKITTNGIGFRFITAFNDNTPVNEAGVQNVTNYTVPSGVNDIVITAYNNHTGEGINLTSTSENITKILSKNITGGYISDAKTLTDGQNITLPQHNVKTKNRYVFNANVTSFSGIRFTKGTPRILVDNQNITITNDLGQGRSFVHGLSILHDITLEIYEGNSLYLEKVKLSSGGNSYEVPMSPVVRFNADSGSPAITSVGSSLTECRLSWTSENAESPLWIFGDSYVSWYAERWPYYAQEDGNLTNCLINGYAGQNSQNALISLRNLLSVFVPKSVVWTLGMNDGDTADAVNENWLTCYEQIKMLASTFGFELILYTVPTTPTINNKFKNDIVRNSGYRFIEADKAVRINENGAWTDDALSSDNVHPTVIGAKILYHRILTDLPEILCK